MDKDEVLKIRKFLAKPFYKLGWKIIQLADKIDGKQPKKKS